MRRVHAGQGVASTQSSSSAQGRTLTIHCHCTESKSCPGAIRALRGITCVNHLKRTHSSKDQQYILSETDLREERFLGNLCPSSEGTSNAVPPRKGSRPKTTRTLLYHLLCQSRPHGGITLPGNPTGLSLNLPRQSCLIPVYHDVLLTSIPVLSPAAVGKHR